MSEKVCKECPKLGNSCGKCNKCKMANTTDIMITSFFNEDIIDEINNKTGLDLIKFSNLEECGGEMNISFETYGTCTRCIGSKNIIELINIFKIACKKSESRYSVLFIDCDEEDELSGVYKF